MGPPVANLSWEKYRGHAPTHTEHGALVLDPRVDPGERALRIWREKLRDPCIVLFKLNYPQIGWFVGRLYRLPLENGGFADTPRVQEILCVESLAEACIALVAARSERFGAPISAEEQIGKPLVEDAAAYSKALAEDTAEAVEDGWGEIVAARDDAGADNRPREDRTAARKRAEAALEEVDGDASKVPPADVGVGFGVRTDAPPRHVAPFTPPSPARTSPLVLIPGGGG